MTSPSGKTCLTPARFLHPLTREQLYFNSKRHLCDGNGKVLFTNQSGSFDFVLNSTDERSFYDQEYRALHDGLSEKGVLSFSLLRELWDVEPCQKVLLESIGDIDGRKVLLLGNGASLKELYFLQKGADVIYTDLSLSVIDCVKKYVNSQSILRQYLNKIEFHAVEAMHTPFCNDDFDVIYGYAFAHHIQEIDRFLREVFRCLKPGGICRFMDDGYSPTWQAMKNSVLKPLQLYSHWKTGISPEDKVATKIGGFRREQILDLGLSSGFEIPIYQKRSFFEHLLNRGTEKLGFRGLRFLQPFLRRIDDYLLHHTIFIQSHGIRLIWGFSKPDGALSKGQDQRLNVFQMKRIQSIAGDLLDLIQVNDWRGYDPYDALTSPILRRIQSKWPRIAVTQFLRYSPINLRTLLKIQRGRNPKALGLLIRAIVRLQDISGNKDNAVDIQKLLELIRSTMTYSEENESVGWGYNFPWQSRVFFREAYAPNIQTTVIIAHALYEIIEHGLLSDTEREGVKILYLDANRYLANHLLVYEDDKKAMLDYFPGAHAQVLNIQAQGAWSLMRANRTSGDQRFASLAKKLINFVLNHQNEDGSWFYGLADSQGFIDNFHTGFILESIHEAMKLNPECGDEKKLKLGYSFYLEHFFRQDGPAKYYHDRTYPIDGHALAQSIITLCKLRSYDSRSQSLLDGVLKWTLANFHSPKGFFYYQKWPLFTNKIPYLRWVQAWMLYALTIVLESERKGEGQCVA